MIKYANFQKSKTNQSTERIISVGNRKIFNLGDSYPSNKINTNKVELLLCNSYIER